MELKDIKLSKEDFEMLIKGLEALPNAGATEYIMSGLLDVVLSDQMSPEMAARRKEEERRKKIKLEQEREIMKENCCVLQAKLIQLRRYMEQNKLILEAQDIIENKD